MGHVFYSTSETPESDIGNTPAQGFDVAVEFGERDLDLVNALQISPRAPWSLIGASLGIDATTAARRWQHLTDTGLAWTTAYAPEFATVGYVRLRCRPDTVAEVSARSSTYGCVFAVDRTSGRYDLQLSVAAESPAALDDFRVRWLAEHPGIEEARLAVAVHQYSDGSHWRPRALDPTQEALLTEGDERAPGAPRRRRGDRELVLALGADARRSAVELAADTGLSDATVRRRISEMSRSGRLIFRCDFAQQAAGWRVNTNIRARIPATDLDALGAALPEWPEIRLCVVTADDESNVMLIAWLRTPQELVTLESRLLHHFPAIAITERSYTLSALKRMGRLLDPRSGIAVGHVPFEVWS